MHYCGWLRNFTGFQPSFWWFIGFCSHPPYDNTENWSFRWFLLYWLFSQWQLHHGWGIYFDICCIVALTAPGYPGVRGYPMFEPYPPQVPTVIRAINKWNTNQPFFHGHALTVAPMFCSFCCWSKLKNFRWIDYTLMWGNLHPISILPTWFNEGMTAMALQNKKIHMVTVIGIALKGKPWKDLRFHTVQQAEVQSEICWFRYFRCHDCLCVDWECFTFNICNVLSCGRFETR